MHKRMEGKKCAEGGIHISNELWAYTIAEFVEIHHLMDLADIPRHVEGEKQSVAQRVKAYTTREEHKAALDVRAEGRLQ